MEVMVETCCGEVQRQHVMKRSRVVSGWSLNAPMLYHQSVLRERF